MSGKIDICERKRVKTLKGVLKETRKNYKTWAYWCGIKRDGWCSTPCIHFKSKNITKKGDL